MATSCPSCRAANDDGARFCASCGTRLTKLCPSCGADLPPQARFCPSCGASLGPAEAPAAGAGPPLEERRFVTIVFADLAGFTERSDQADPEDVRRILVPFHAVAKEEIERFGGTLDKFIGDAAMGVFGAPVAHEDDPERAVRAALAIRERMTDGNLPVRIAVHTGEALVTLGEGPMVGERVAGDVVNTASRLQSFAPEGSVIVGEPTERATRHVIDYRPLPATRVKGKAEPLVASVATAIRADALEREEDDPPPFVGRTRERELLRDLLERAVGNRAPQLVTVIGEPGIGKSRLVIELHDRVISDHGPAAAWHRGHCRPYGESITFAALDEVVRSIAGIALDDLPDEAVGKLDAELTSLDLNDDDRAWIAARLRPIIGAPGDDDPPADNVESFAAWSRFLEAVAERAPLTIVIEDLHWADDAMLAFLEHLMEHAPGVPLFLLCTARPELFARRARWAAEVTDATTISLSPLSDREMTDLLGAMLRRSVMSADGGGVVMRRAGGNPLYAREFVQMLEDRGLVGAGASESLGEGVPDTVQALIAARLDALDPSERNLLQVASVIGDRFWAGALAEIAPDVADLDASLRTLQRRGLVRRSSISSIATQTELAFAHGLIRDVAYGRLPRPVRSRLHRSMTGWLESAAESMTGQAELIASHATRALDLARASGLDAEVPELEAAALRSLVRAGERQVSLDAAIAAQHYQQALALAPPGAERAEIRRDVARLGWRSGGLTSDEALEQYRMAEGEAMDAGDRRLAARVLRRIYYLLGQRGETSEAQAALEQAIALVENDPEAREVLAELYACRSEAEMLAGHSEESLRWAHRALELPRTQSVMLMALHLRGNARCETGDLGGVDDLREALAVAEASGVAIDIVTSHSYLLEWVGLEEGPPVALPMNRSTIDLCRRRGIEGQGMWTRAEGYWLRFDSGLWDELLADTDEVGAWARSHGDTQIATVANLYRARVIAHRGDASSALELADSFVPAARLIEDLQVLAPALMAGIVTHAVAGDHTQAVALAQELDVATSGGPSEYRELYLPEVVRAVIAAGELDFADRLVGSRPMYVRRTRLAVASARALLADAAGDLETAADGFRDVAQGWKAWGGRFEEAHSAAGLARCLEALGRTGESVLAANRADSIFDSLGVKFNG